MDENFSGLLPSEVGDGLLLHWNEDSSSEQLPKHLVVGDRGEAEDDVGVLMGTTVDGADNAGEWFRAHAGLFLNSAPEIETPREAPLRERVVSRPPPGCAPDAIKLFVGNIPKSYTETQLLPLFQTIGQVVDLVVVRDKTTRESKGSAFVWYATRAQAELAMSKLNMRYILPDPTGKQTRPLALRKAQQGQTGPTSAPSPAAKASRRPSPPSGLSQTTWATSFPVGATGGLDSFGYDPILPHAPAAPDAHLDGMHASASAAIMNSLAQAFGRAQVSGPSESGVAAAAAAAAAAQAGLLDSRDRVDIGPHSTPQLYSGHGLGSNIGSNLGPMDYLPGAAPPVQLDAQRPSTLNIAISREQLVLVSEYAHRMQSMSGAKVNISPAEAAGVFNLCLIGSQLQVDTARMLLCRILGLN